jgi:small-conductance mechanosensitive channel
MANVLTYSFLGNTVLSYLTAVGILFGGGLIILVAYRFALRRFAATINKSTTKADDIALTLVQKTILPALWYGLLYLSLSSLALNPGLEKLLKVAGVVLLTFLSVRFVISVFTFALFQYWVPKHVKKGESDQQFRGLLPAVYVVVWGIALVFMLDNLGFKVSAILAGLGIGGVALALASQAVLADLFSYFAILFDRPFVIGDFIIVGSQMGTVENIGIKTTRVHSLSGEQLVFGNKELTSQTIQNFKRMFERRVVFSVSIDYQTPMEQIRAVPALLKDTVQRQSATRFDRAHFAEYQPAGLRFEVVYFVLTGDYNKYMDIQQEINFRIKEEFAARNIEFAHTLQVVQMRPAPAPSTAATVS